MKTEPNYLIITLDSCRWDTFEQALTPNLDSLCKMVRAYAQATFTYAAHVAIYQGHLPSARNRQAYANRFVKPLFRISTGGPEVDSHITFPRETRTIIHGFRQLGYYTIGVGATGWFRHPDLSSPFHSFTFTGIHADLQVKLVTSNTKDLKGAFFALLNFGETHEPYEFGEAVPWTGTSRARSLLRAGRGQGFDRAGWRKQVSACEFLDEKIGELVTELRSRERGTVVVVCADHGECFGEEGLYGHGFYHPKVMEVPLGMFEINCHVL